MLTLTPGLMLLLNQSHPISDLNLKKLPSMWHLNRKLMIGKGCSLKEICASFIVLMYM